MSQSWDKTTACATDQPKFKGNGRFDGEI